MASKRIFLIDGTAFSYRAFYAIRNLSTKDGHPTNAVFGFALMLKSLREKENPDGLAVAFDVGKPTFRHQKFERYKIQRKPMPDFLISQIPTIKRLLEAYRIPIFEQEGFEAEDVLGTIAKKIAGKGVDVFLVTGDKDALQLVDSHIKIYNPHHPGQQVILDRDAVEERYGVGPERVVDLMALMGDDIDNIPSVPGIGEKTAAALIKQFGSLEKLYSRLEDVESDARRNALADSKSQVELSRELARIDTQVPVEVSLADLAIQEPDWRTLRSLLRELEFRKLLAEIDQQMPDEENASQAKFTVAEGDALERCLDYLEKRKPAAISCQLLQGEANKETDEAKRNGHDSLFEEMDEPAALLGASGADGQVWILRLTQAFLSSSQGKRLAAWLSDDASLKLGHNLKVSLRVFGRFNLAVSGLSGDTMIAGYLLNPARSQPPLADLADEYLDLRLRADEAGGNQAVAGALSAIHRLHAVLVERLEKQALKTLYESLELPLVSVLAEMESAGIAIDRGYLADLSKTMQGNLSQLTEEVYRLAGTEFNVNSPKQLSQVLFERLQLPVIKRTKTGPSTDSDVLKQLSQQHPLPERLIQYRELSKLVSTYVDALPALADSEGRVHTSFNQTVTSTGRLSSSEPNLQNIPIKTELGRMIRRAFIPGIKDAVLLTADYSQIELRVLAHLSGDEHLIKAFKEEKDIHRFTASLIYGIPEKEVQPEQRSAMKAVNFGILYGMSSHGLSRELGISFEEAQSFIDAYFARYPGVRGYLDSQIAKAKREGFVSTLMGRRRYIPEVNSPDAILRQVGERMAVNAPVQGTAADLMKKAMVDLSAELSRGRFASRLVLQVHDELVLEVLRKELDPLILLVRRVMEQAAQLVVPLTVTVKTGLNWLELEPVR